MTLQQSFNEGMLSRWRTDPIGFIENKLIDPESGRPFVLLPAEREFLKHVFSFREDGRLQYPELIYSCPKKSGKTTLEALVIIAMVVLFGGRYAEAIIAANDYEQASSRAFTVARHIIESSPLLASDARFTQDRITIGTATIKAIPSNYASAAGANQCVSGFDELWAYSSEPARRLFDELVPPPTRKIACRLTVTYAGFTGESALLEELYARGMAQPLVGPDLHAGDGILMFWSHTPVAPWQNQAWLDDMRKSMRPNQYLRMIENKFVTNESTFVDLSMWDKCVDDHLGHAQADKSLPIWVGVDASVKHDQTAVVACTFDEAAKSVKLVTHRVFQPSPTEPLNFEQTIERTLLELQQRYQMVKVLFDPYQMQATAQRLLRAGVPIQEFPQSSPNLTAASQNLYDLIQSQSLVAYADANLRLAVSRAVATETPRGWRITKATQSHKIDVVIALAMAAYSCVQDRQEFDPVYQSMDWVGSSSPQQDADNWATARKNAYILSGGSFVL